jgi:glycosyltransferase involved in cell wall biosynthesis
MVVDRKRTRALNRAILFDARLALSKPTGIGQYISSLVPRILAQAGDLHLHLLRGHEPFAGYGLANLEAPNLTHHVTRRRPMSPLQHSMLPRVAEKLEVDLVHYPHFDAPVLFGRLPVLATIHDVKYLSLPGLFPRFGALKRLYMQWAYRTTLRRAAAVIAVSHSTAEDLNRLFEAAPDRISVIYEAADEVFKPVADERAGEVLRRHDLRGPFILSVGELRPHKNFERLIEAYAGAGCSNSHDLVIVGQRYRDYRGPQQITAELSVVDNVRFLTATSSEDLVALYSAADVFALVSLYEVFGLPVLEAMACHTPVVASSTTALAEVVDNGGILVDPMNPRAIGRALDSLTSSPAVRRQYVEAGKKRCRVFSWEKTADRTIELYRNLWGD